MPSRTRRQSIRPRSTVRIGSIAPAVVRARIGQRERSLAHWRFWVVLVTVIVLTAYLSIVAWHQIQRLFGL